MNLSISDFWRLLAESRLLASPQVKALAAEFAKVDATSPPTAQTLAQWLVKRNVLSRYQALILLSGRAGPFHYGEYKVYDRLDKGCLAGYFRAVHAASGHPVVLKFLKGAIISQPHMWRAAADNVRAASQLVSPHLQRYFEPVELSAFKFVVSEDLRGSTLDEQLTHGKVAPSEACRIARLVSLGLAQLHAANRAHGSIRPASVLLEPAARQPANAKLLFDAQQLPGPLDLADEEPTGRLAAMADYVAPELLAPGRNCDPGSDIYALGCTLYAMLSGKPPYSAGSIKEKLARHSQEGPPPLEPLGVPPALAQLVSRFMAKQPAGRIQSAAQAAEKLAMFVEPAALRTQPPTPPPTLAAYEEALTKRQTAATPQGPAAPIIVSPAASPKAATTREPAAPVAASAPGSVAPSAAAVVSAPALAPVVNVAAKARNGRTAEEVYRARKAQQRRNLVLGLCGMALVVGAAGLLFFFNGRQAASNSLATANVLAKPAGVVSDGSAADTAANPVTSAPPAVSSAVGRPAANPKAPPSSVADDGKSLWAAPTAGPPLALRLVPPEGQVFLIVRPADLVASEEGQRVLAALGPAFDAQRKAFEAASGFGLAEIEQLLVTLHNNDARFPRASFVVKSREPNSVDALLAKWGNPAAATEQSQTYYAGPTWAYYVSRAPEDERTFAMGDVRDIKEVAAAGGAPPAVFRDITRLLRSTDAERHVTLLFYPQFLFNDDGEPLFAAERAKVRKPLGWLLGDYLQAACVSAQFGDEFYFETRMLASLDKEPYQLAEEVRDRLNKVPAALEDYLVGLSPPTYWKKLAFRFPAMIRELHSQLRVGVEDKQAIVNAVLPGVAAHNLVLGGELLVATTPGQAAAASAAAAPAASGPKTIAEALQVKSSFSFDNQSLEFAMRDLAEDVKSNLKGAPFEFAIKIIGDDLKIDGITRNQSIRDFKQENQTVAEILTALVRKANPITTVKDPSEPDQKLIWVIGPDPDSLGKETVLITTRAAAAAKKYTLPGAFVANKK